MWDRLVNEVRRRRGAFVLVIAVLALVPRLAFSVGYWVDEPLNHDEVEYLTLAESLAAGRGFVYADDRRDHFSRAPGYPAFLAGVLTIWDSHVAVKVVQSALGVLGVFLIAGLARRAAGDSAWLIAAIAASIYPPFVWLPAYFLRELLHSVLVLGAATLLWRGLDTKVSGELEIRRFVLTGVVLGVATLVRPNVAVLICLIGAWLGVRVSVRAAAAVCLAAALIITPWTVRNYEAHDRFMLVSALGGLAFWIGNNPQARGEGDLASNPLVGRAEAAIRAAHPSLSPEQLETVYYREAGAFIRAHPVAWLFLLAKKLCYFIVPVGPSIFMRSALFRTASWVSYFSLLPVGAIGFRRLLRAQQQPIPVWLLGLSALMTILIFYPQQRYRVPVFDPVLIICASTLMKCGSGLRTKSVLVQPVTRS